jgi:putative colanic acid biosysnthesis UDP-glucose lipid carrier transferase
MTRPYSIYQRTRYLIDAPLITIIFLLLYNYFPSGMLVTSDAYIILFIIFSIMAWYSVAQLSGLYRDLRSNKFSEEIIYIVITGLLFAVVLTSFLFFVRWDIQFNDLFIILYFALIFISVVCTKYILRKYIHRIFFSKKLQEHVLLVGATPAAKNFYDTINSNYYYGYHCLGFIDNEEAKLNGATYFGNLDQLGNIFTRHHVDEVIIALPNSQYQQIRTTLETCDFHGKRVRIIPDFYTYATSNIQINNIGLLPVINLRSLPLDTWGNKILKRAFDICFSATFFIILGWWIMPLIALMIKLTSNGPVIFKQERWGLNNEKIICYKFRTMYHGAPETDENGHFLQASSNDSRVTPLGKFLRKNNFDEYPQFWNVLIGNMSVVGPRPHVTPLNLASIESVHRYMHRHLVKPGITGWAQVNGARGETTAPEAMQRRVNLDLYYIHKWTFWMDCQIILQSVINIIKGDQKAY